MDPGIVADVDDGVQFVAGILALSKLAQAEQPLHSEQEAGAPDAPDQNSDFHTRTVPARRDTLGWGESW
ncbi:hypothetical protein MPRG_09070 [Mycobacterium paragordonae]|uniref:Uncharacterized protein n=1 Tax=Mycobacterium paragordonae TaxID=1389713 RepID=A0ABQ1BZN3_9MYCO|nr:hypothetical protein MPRG_09070 [Mycobacterium paragordonae]